MSAGSNVKIVLFIGEEDALNALPVTSVIIGNWSSPWNIRRTYRFPGDYKVTAIISNSVSLFTISKKITVMSNVSGLIVNLKNSPVIFRYQSINGFGRAYFQFHYQLNTLAASHANVSFTISSTSKKFGPFWLGMNFIQNISKTPLFYDFLDVGNYTVLFFVTNAISETTLYLNVNVVKGLFGIHVILSPSSLVPGQILNLSAYIEQGDNSTLEWIIDGTSLGIRQRICNRSYFNT